MAMPANPSIAVVLLPLLLSLLEVVPPVSAKLKTSTITFNNVTSNSNNNLQVNSPAAISNGSLQLTLDIANLSSRIQYNTPFKLWEGQSASYTDRVASFNASFLVSIYRFDNYTHPGEGLAFVVAPDLNVPPNSYGQYLGLTNSTTDGNVSNGLIAVELDTCKADIDPDSNHIGLDINSVRSNITASLTPLGYQLVGEGTKANFTNIWVEYDGVKKVIKVYIAQQANKMDPTPPRPDNPILISNLDLREVVNQYSYFGFSSSTSNVGELNCACRWNLTVERWNLTVEHYCDEKYPLEKIGLATWIPRVVLLMAVVAMVALLYDFRERISSERWNRQISRKVKNMPGMVREYHFRDLQKATNDFSERMILGRGAYGVVYKGYLANQEDPKVAVKMFSRGSLKGQDDFMAELQIIYLLGHKNLVKLRGWCHSHGKLLLIYDYMPKGSLDQHLFSDANSDPLRWDLRHKIILGLASALLYLHNEYHRRVIHRDLKASNVMLDSEFNAKLGDFGLARALDNEENSYATAQGIYGTTGYIAPEYLLTRKATQQSDVYAFGAVLLEVVCGRRPGDQIGRYPVLVDWVWALLREGRLLEAVDNRLQQDYVVEQAQRVLLLGLACSHPIASERPETQDLVQILSGLVDVPHLPLFKPAFVLASLPMGEEDNSSATTTDTTSHTTSHHRSGWTPFAINPETQCPYSDIPSVPK